MSHATLLMLAAVSHLTDLAVPGDLNDPQYRRAQQLRHNYICYPPGSGESGGAFQRNYSWGADEWNDLWQDIIGLFGEDPEPAHYMGYLVLQSVTT